MLTSSIDISLVLVFENGENKNDSFSKRCFWRKTVWLEHAWILLFVSIRGRFG